MSQVVAVTNQKGGVGKTTTAINLAASLALADQRVLLIDLDPQGNLTSGVGLRGQRTAAGTIYDALTSDPPRSAADFILPTAVDKLQAIPSDGSLTGAEIELVSLPERERRLRRVIDPIRHDFDRIFIDCPPSLGLLTVNALAACDTVLVPLQCEYYALEGLARLSDTITRIQSGLNEKLHVAGVLLTMYDPRSNLAREVADEVRKHFHVYDTVIPRNIRLAEAPSHGKPVVLYDAGSRGSAGYLSLARELLGAAA